MENNIVRKSIGNALGAVIAAALAGTAFAAPPPPPPPIACTNFSSTLTAWNDCVGLTSGNTNVAGANAAFAGDPTFGVEYKDNQTGAGSDTAVFDLLDNGNDSVTLKFLQNVGNGTSSAVIGLKFGGGGVNQLGFFRFDNADFNAGDMLNFSWNTSFNGDGISHATVYANTVERGQEIPEPAPLALMLASLAGIAAATRRRRGWR